MLSSFNDVFTLHTHHHSYGNTELYDVKEDVAATDAALENVSSYLQNLTFLLVKKGLITEAEVIDLLQYSSNVDLDKDSIRIEQEDIKISTC